MFCFNIINSNDSKDFYKYLTNNIKIEHHSSNLIIKSYKRYNYFFKIFLTFDYLFFFNLMIFILISKNNYYDLRLCIFTIIFIILILYGLFNCVHYIFYTLFKLKPCYFKFDNDSVSFSILKVSKKKKRSNPTYSASSRSKGYRGILVKKDVNLKYEGIKIVDYVINLGKPIPNSFTTHASIRYTRGLDFVIITNDKTYFILSDLFSSNDMNKIYLELKNRIK